MSMNFYGYVDTPVKDIHVISTLIRLGLSEFIQQKREEFIANRLQGQENERKARADAYLAMPSPTIMMGNTSNTLLVRYKEALDTERQMMVHLDCDNDLESYGIEKGIILSLGTHGDCQRATEAILKYLSPLGDVYTMNEIAVDDNLTKLDVKETFTSLLSSNMSLYDYSSLYDSAKNGAFETKMNDTGAWDRFRKYFGLTLEVVSEADEKFNQSFGKTQQDKNMDIVIKEELLAQLSNDSVMKPT